jgi:hypothetical protein
MPSPFASRRAPGWEPREPLGFNPTLARVVPSRTMPIARTSRGRCNTTRDQVALANSRVLATRFVGLSPNRANDGYRRSDRASRARFRTERGAPVKSVEPDSPFIAARRCIRTGSVAEVRVASSVTSARPLRGTCRHVVRERASRGCALARSLARIVKHPKKTWVSPGLPSPGHLVVAAPYSHERRNTFIRVAAGRSSTRSAGNFVLPRREASVTRPAKGEILVTNVRCLPSVWMRRRAGSLPSTSRDTGLRVCRLSFTLP